MDAQAVAGAIRRQLGGAVAGSGVEVDDVVIHPAGKRRLVRVTVARDVSNLAVDDQDSPVPPLSLDEVAQTTRLVNQVLDDSDLMGEAPYTLEVTSPGVDQPLVTHAQFRRNVGRLLSLSLADGPQDQQVRLRAVGADGIRTDADPQTVVPFAQIVRAKVQVEFTTPAPGKDR